MIRKIREYLYTHPAMGVALAILLFILLVELKVACTLPWPAWLSIPLGFLLISTSILVFPSALQKVESCFPSLSLFRATRALPDARLELASRIQARWNTDPHMVPEKLKFRFVTQTGEQALVWPGITGTALGAGQTIILRMTVPPTKPRSLILDARDEIESALNIPVCNIMDDPGDVRSTLVTIGPDLPHKPITITEFQRRTGGLMRWFIPIGLNDRDLPEIVPLGHTLVVGVTGSGKGSILWTYLMGAERYASQHATVLSLFGWDPKHAEFAGNRASAFTDIAYTPEEGLAMLRSLVSLMRSRQKVGQRSFEPSRKNGYVLLAIDEFNTLTVSSDAAWKKQVHECLLALLSQGRSAGIYVVASAQQPQKESIGDYRQHFVNRICLRVESRIETDLVLGNGATEQGAEPHLISPATESNGYATAGIGYVRSQMTGRLERFRAPKLNDTDIAQWSNKHTA